MNSRREFVKSVCAVANAFREAPKQVEYRGWLAAEVSGGDRQHLADVLARMNRVVGQSDGKPAPKLPGAARNVG
jgi:hypothetical protein